MRFVIALFLLVSLSACSFFKEKAGCLIQDRIATAAADVVADKLQCQNKLAIRQDIEQAFSYLKLCPTEAGFIADRLCPIATGALVEFVASRTIPKEWQCSAVLVKEQLRDALLGACLKLPVSEQ